MASLLDRWHWALLLICLCFGSYFGLRASTDTRQPARPAAAASTVADAQPRTKSIEDIRVGMRTVGRNPLREQVETAAEPDPETSRVLVIRMKKESGGNASITLLRPLAWIEAVGVEEGGTFFLDLPEMGAVGDAQVEAILPCPAIEEGPGNVVTGTFAREAAPGSRILSVSFANGAHIEGGTDNHPFYSVDRDDFIAIGEMREGESVKVRDGVTRITQIDSRLARPGEMLYNLETHNEHVYQVATAGVLVHNNCITGSIRGMKPNKVARDIMKRQPKWKKLPVEKGHGWRIIDDNGIERMRYMYPQKNAKFVHEQTGYFVRQNADKKFLDIDGSIIPDGPDQITLRHLFDTSL